MMRRYINIVMVSWLWACGPDYGHRSQAVTRGTPFTTLANGSRLKHVQILGADGSVSMGNWLIDDTLSVKWGIDFRCGFSVGVRGDGAAFCVPVLNAAFLPSAAGAFADNACTTKLATTSFQAFYAYEVKTNRWGVSVYEYRYIDREHLGDIYISTGASCVKTIRGGPNRYYVPGGIVPWSEFVAGEEVAE